MRFLIFLILCPAAYACDVEGDGETLYSRYYEIAYKETGKDESGQRTSEARILNQEQAKLAHSCLLQAAEKNSCSAYYMLSLYYQHGNFGSNIPITKNEALAQQFNESSKTYCKGNT
jgi:hypothetical protein